MSRDGLEALVIGVGNLLWADEGFGVRCAEAFGQCYTVPSDVEVMDGGTQGLSLVNVMSEAKRILIFDAVDLGLPPADLVLARGEDVPKFAAGNKVSLHQSSMMEVLALAEFMGGGAPEKLTLIGCQPVELDDYGGGLRPAVAARVPEALELAKRELESWGLPIRDSKQSQSDAIMPSAVGWHPYESERPSAQDACRFGDARVLARSEQEA